MSQLKSDFHGYIELHPLDEAWMNCNFAKNTQLNCHIPPLPTVDGQNPAPPR